MQMICPVFQDSTQKIKLNQIIQVSKFFSYSCLSPQFAVLRSFTFTGLRYDLTFCCFVAISLLFSTSCRLQSLAASFS